MPMGARYRIAGLLVEMDAFGRTLEQARPYLESGDGPADLTVRCDPEAVLNANPQISDRDMAYYMGSGSEFARQLLRRDGFQLHASAVVLDGYAYLFSAPSGMGKSTHTEKWCRLFGAVCLNDDKPALRREAPGWIAYGTPWSGKKDLSRPISAPLGGIAFLHRGDQNTISRLTPDEAVPMLISQSLRYLTAEQMGLQLALLDRLLREVPVWELVCRNEDAAAHLSREAMTGGKEQCP